MRMKTCLQILTPSSRKLLNVPVSSLEGEKWHLIKKPCEGHHERLNSIEVVCYGGRDNLTTALWVKEGPSLTEKVDRVTAEWTFHVYLEEMFLWACNPLGAHFNCFEISKKYFEMCNLECTRHHPQIWLGGWHLSKERYLNCR